jgi:hypothetical protein
MWAITISVGLSEIKTPHGKSLGGHVTAVTLYFLFMRFAWFSE